MENIANNADVLSDAEAGSATAGAASGSTGQIGAAVGSDRADRNYTSTQIDSDVGEVEAAKRGTLLEAQILSIQLQNNLQLQNRIAQNAATFDAQIMQNAIENANLATKAYLRQVERHADLACETQWAPRPKKGE